MLILNGRQALSDFRVQKLQQRMTALGLPGLTIQSRYVHLVDVDEGLTSAQQPVLDSLLEYGPKSCEFEEMADSIWVFPRPGTISPWSSKATDIAHICGLTGIKRIERGLQISVSSGDYWSEIEPLLHDRMIETVFTDLRQAEALFKQQEPRPLLRVPLLAEGISALQSANKSLGLALSDDEIEYLKDSYIELDRDPSDVELMMFAQANSEHCRHKIFNADWQIDGETQDLSLFAMIRNTYQLHHKGILSAYKDNSAVIEGFASARFCTNSKGEYESQQRDQAILMKVETHNHPTAISPFPGAATGSGGEIRDEGATGRGSRPKAGLCGFSVSNLKIPGFQQPWERDFGKPERIDSALSIMTEGPLGAAAFNNEFGRPNIAGYFRTFEMQVASDLGTEIRGYHKPIMLAGGVGAMDPQLVEKERFPAGSKILVLGGPAMLIGLGGGAASSMSSGSSAADLDFASVQRGNPEMERRCQEVIDRCYQQGEKNPILSLHDVGAGGLSNALPELVNDAGKGARFELREVPNDEPGMSPMEIWCNESQERYVLAVAADRLADVLDLCARERCPVAVLGEASDKQDLIVEDRLLGQRCVDLPLNILLGKPPKMSRSSARLQPQHDAFNTQGVLLNEAIERVLRLPAVADKSFLINIGDRSVGGLVARDQMVGPWQVPVADVAVTAGSFEHYHGEAMSVGERTPLAILDAPASGRMAIGEALTNLYAADVTAHDRIVLSANWMCAAGHADEDARLFDTVKAVGMELCPQLGITIPVGKDSMSMKTVWKDQSVTAPLSLIISAFSPVSDIRKTLTPQLQTDGDPSVWLLDLSAGKQRLGGSALAQVYEQIGQQAPDLDQIELFQAFQQFMHSAHEQALLSAYHDRSDGGTLVALMEMAFSSRMGLDIRCDDEDVLRSLMHEELGVLVQVAKGQTQAFAATLQRHGLSEYCSEIAKIAATAQVTIHHKGRDVWSKAVTVLHQSWSATSWQMQRQRDNPDCADEAYAAVANEKPALWFKVNESHAEQLNQAPVVLQTRPKVAVLREQGVNGQIEMAAAFDRAGFTAVDVHMSDLLEGRHTLKDFQVLAACGGFSYGDVLGAGEGWAKSILYNDSAREQFETFFNRTDSLSLGICNGCQMMSNLKNLIPGAANWPHFVRNRSEQFEARLSMVEIRPNNSPWLTGMAGSQIPVVVAHGEGRAEFTSEHSATAVLHYLNDEAEVAMNYPANPNGSPNGQTGFCSEDGRVLIMMPHPERVFRNVQYSWNDHRKAENSPWFSLFSNAAKALG